MTADDLPFTNQRITWACHICKARRDDEHIGVCEHEIRVNGILVKENIRYCLDRPICVERAKAYHLLGEQDTRASDLAVTVRVLESLVKAVERYTRRSVGEDELGIALRHAHEVLEQVSL